MNLLELKENQQVSIKKDKYEILNMIKFVEKSSYWVEYKIRKLEDGKLYYLEISLGSNAVLYELLKDEKIEPKMVINFEGEEYELYESGTEKVETYYGVTDVALKEEAKYYEYVSKINNKKVISVERWGRTTEVSKGKKITLLDIKY